MMECSTVRRIMCLTIKKDHRKRSNRVITTRLRSSVTINRNSVSVGEVIGLSLTTTGKFNSVINNLSEVHTMYIE